MIFVTLGSQKFQFNRLLKKIDELKLALQSEFEYSNIFAIKDPRLAFLFPVYKQVLEDLDINIKIVLPYRNPIEVANSLRKRDISYTKRGKSRYINDKWD